MPKPELIKKMEVRGARKDELDFANMFFELCNQSDSLDILNLYEKYYPECMPGKLGHWRVKIFTYYEE